MIGITVLFPAMGELDAAIQPPAVVQLHEAVARELFPARVAVLALDEELVLDVDEGLRPCSQFISLDSRLTWRLTWSLQWW